MKDTLKQVLWAIAEARQDGLSIDVSGMDEFDINDFSDELDDAKKLLDLGIGSETLRKQIFKSLAFKYLCDSRQEIKNRVADEIEEQDSTDETPREAGDAEAIGVVPEGVNPRRWVIGFSGIR